MSRFVENLRQAGSGVIEREHEVEHIFGHPHPLWQEMCDVVDAASKLQRRIDRRQPLYTARIRLRDALDALAEHLEGQ